MKKEIMFSHRGDGLPCLNVVVEGKVHIIKEDLLGQHKSILTEIGVGELF
ncbi:MAG: hypothetical protein V8S74_09240 [Lachnospirales bacterium]